MPRNKSKQELTNWYIHRAYYCYRQAQMLFGLFDYVESSISSFEAIEFSVKAMCRLFGVCFKREHFVDAETMSILAEKVGEARSEYKEQILQALPIILSYNEILRNVSRYGIERADVPNVSPTQIFGRSYAETVFDDAKTFCDMLRRLETRKRWGLKLS